MAEEPAQPKAFSGRKRERKTQKSVLLADLVARIGITFGGIGTIVAVIAVCVFLVAVTMPLFRSAVMTEEEIVDRSWEEQSLLVRTDEYRILGWVLTADGKLRVFRADDGSVRDEHDLFPGKRITTVDFPTGKSQGAVGLDDGSIHIINVKFATSFIPDKNVPVDLRTALEDANDEKHTVNFGKGVLQRTVQGQYRQQLLTVRKVKGVELGNGGVDHVAFGPRPDGPFICALAGRKLFGIEGKEVDDFLTGERTLKFNDPIGLPFKSLSDSDVKFLGVSGSGTDIYAVWEDGKLLRLNARSLSEAKIAETGRLIEPGKTITNAGWVLANSTLVWGDSDGRVQGGFLVRIPDKKRKALRDFVLEHGLPDAQRAEGEQFTFALTKTLERQGAKLTTMAASERSRMVLCGFDDGSVKLYNVTNEGCLASLKLPETTPLQSLVFAPKEDGLMAVNESGKIFRYGMDPMYPEVTLGSLFTPVWYEGYQQPVHTWQSSAGHTGAEPKFGMMPLVFGTIKATLYAMLFGAPIALLAAIYSSEFLHPRVKAGVKPTIEMMASLPSVVLGFIAALVIAPVVENIVPASLTAFFILPIAFLMGAYIWQLLPQTTTNRLMQLRFALILIPIVLGILASALIGPWIEDLLFSGSVKAWLQYDPLNATEEQKRLFAGSTYGWMVLLLPITAMVVAFTFNRTVGALIRTHGSGFSRTQLAVIDLVKFFAGLALAILLAFVVGFAFDFLGFDPRGPWNVWGMDFSVLGTYEQRNSLIVGVFMGFAVIPIIYTIADDALGSVPEHLRSASLGAGATPWQTATRIVIPTAMSGLFSALMIGLGRAVGETMIVLMATGNTPVLELNIFNGLRTLSANIAVELPEAAKGDVHYRTLFFAALVLFAMTFLVNTVAEAVRQHFRKKAFQL